MTNFKRFSVTLIACTICIPAVLSSVNAEPLEQYAIAKTKDGFVRTNVATGHTSICTLTQSTLICRASIDEIRAFEDTNEQLQKRISTLEAKLAEIDKGSKNKLDFAESEDLDKAMDMMEGFMTRFFDMAKNLKFDENG